MGVYIKDMEMPTSCWDCYFQDCGNCRLNVHKVVDKCIIEDRRDEDCPLVPVPPHGRLIDADALIKNLSLDENDAENGASLLMAVFLEVLKAAPTIIQAEEGE